MGVVDLELLSGFILGSLAPTAGPLVPQKNNKAERPIEPALGLGLALGIPGLWLLFFLGLFHYRWCVPSTFLTSRFLVRDARTAMAFSRCTIASAFSWQVNLEP